MTGFAKFMGAGVAVHQQTEVTAISRVSQGWHLAHGGSSDLFDGVVLTAPAPQSSALVRNEAPEMAHIIDEAEFDPCLALMVGLNTAPMATFACRLEEGDVLSWVARDSSKPGRPRRECWVAQANADWSSENIARPSKEIEELLLPSFLQTVGAAPSDVVHSDAHRWRYARVSRPLGRPFVADRSATLFAGGDWCLGPRVEAAWTSGTEIAKAILES
jgi:renalase